MTIDSSTSTILSNDLPGHELWLKQHFFPNGPPFSSRAPPFSARATCFENEATTSAPPPREATRANGSWQLESCFEASKAMCLASRTTPCARDTLRWDGWRVLHWRFCVAVRFSGCGEFILRSYNWLWLNISPNYKNQEPLLCRCQVQGSSSRCFGVEVGKAAEHEELAQAPLAPPRIKGQPAWPLPPFVPTPKTRLPQGRSEAIPGGLCA